MEGEVTHKRKRAYQNELSEKNSLNKKIVFFHMVYLTLLFMACFVGGVLLGFWTTSYTPEISILEDDANTFQFRYINNRVIIGAKLNIKLSVTNNTTLTYSLSAESVKYFYYPVGANHGCLLYNGGLGESSANQTPLSRRSEISVPTNKDERTFPTKLSIKIKYSLLTPSSVIHTVPFHLGYELTNEQRAEVQPLYNDCKRFNRLYFSVRLDDLYISNEFRKVQNEKKYELIFSCKCSIDANVDAFFNSTPIYKAAILGNLANDPSLLG
ncbi:conserved Plasmodium protein, unknown function [Plasmodium vivax]|uniref:Uncharacterized protein n=6 Tax=Plasmodium vivax TaxID=5855 RepID=A5K768_PLAVS|nr:hypothetical protein, conserved [Plasmodium vivax]KMZ81014.1 hypothetical protein PVIIG_04532 [Plasmodium vivax India VII]KMZ86905.1 hypothetical protein PVBG_02746 [Plasmodium vivax Brazil I]KMZ93339.1 hypothetical protein PVMG_00785 [Plasmodium vivax Mauritania I]KNA00187.1 hypothetical protein PVNG_03527 [Plasmodium vivax North Korean]EDL44627.1 hypothetical protein, conserved [Plasmodium vivax]|eukprot:XP_001614354.1 hypothetical protein [Plasmodium vivax Sal-1]